MPELHPITIETLRELINVEWFRCVGVNDIQDSTRTTIVGSWEEAMNLADTIEWSNLRLDAANTYRFHLMARNPERLSHWNEVVRKVKPYSEGLVEDKAGKLFSEPKVRSKIERVIRWDMLHLLMECEYAASIRRAGSPARRTGTGLDTFRAGGRASIPAGG